MMTDHMILTPYFLDEPAPGLRPLARPDWQLIDPALPHGDQQQRMTAVHRSLAAAVAEAVRRGERPVSIAGDCCTTIGVLAGLLQTGVEPAVIWFDAHGDFNTWETTPSGFLGGMPLAMLVGRGEQQLLAGVGLRPLAEERVILTDARDLDPGEREAVASSAVTHLADVALLQERPLPDGPLYVHFDTDVLDPADVPAMNYPAPNGPDVDSMRQVFRRLAATGRVAAVSVSTWNPELDEDGRSQAVIMSLLADLLA